MQKTKNLCTEGRFSLRTPMKVLVALLLIIQGAHAQPLYHLPQGVETRWASPENPTAEKGQAARVNAGRKGRAFVPLGPGQAITLAEASGTSGVVRRIWITISDRSPIMLRSLKLDIFWDGMEKPAVSVPLGDFFGMGLGRMAAFQSALFASPEGKSFNCFIPMPFKKGMKIVVTNESSRHLEAFYYDVDYTLGDKLDADTPYFHAYYHRENPTSFQKDYQILPKVSGRGRFLGVCIGVKSDQEKYRKLWWGEGEVKMYIDGDQEYPTLSGTGTEDYIGDGWGLNQFAHLYTGAHYADTAEMRYSFYRYHIPDPVYFSGNIRVTIQQIGWGGPGSDLDSVYSLGTPLYKTGPGLIPKEKGSTGIFERQDDWSSCAYFYLDQPVNSLPSIDPVDLRIENIE